MWQNPPTTDEAIKKTRRIQTYDVWTRFLTLHSLFSLDNMGVKKKRENTIMYFIKIKRGMEFARVIVRYLVDKNDKLIPS